MRPFKRILCEAGLGDTRMRVLERAVDLAQKNQAELAVIDIIEPWPGDWGESQTPVQRRSIRHAREQRLEQTLVPFRKRMAIDVHSATVTSMPFLALVREVIRGEYDLVIRESEDPDWIDCALGSDDMQLLRACPCPVWLLDPAAPQHCRRLLVAVDVDRQYPAHELETRRALNRLTLQLACSQAILESAELHVVHAWQPESVTNSYHGMSTGQMNDYDGRRRTLHQRELARLLEHTEDYIGPESFRRIELQEHLLDGSPRRLIPQLVRRMGIDLVVMGSVARTGIKGLLIGNTAEAILTQLDCSVLVVKPPGFETPVTLED
ncbi:MAG: universal stress protein [Granulosicoccus sp.]|nr:universal stress protein [Granulosicoccus sp.]